MLLQYELNKILHKKLNLVAMLIGYVILAITTIYPVVSQSEDILKTDTTYKGLEAIQYNQEMAGRQTKVLTEEYVTKVLKEIQSSGVEPNTDEGYCMLKDQYGNLYNYLMNSYRNIKEQGYQPEILLNVNLKNGAGFYERRLQKIEEYVNMDFSDGNYTDAEKSYWISKAENVTTPFKWGDIFVPMHYDLVISLAFYFLFVLVICISPVFAGEHENGAAGILLASKYGQRKLVWAKVTASYIFSFLYIGIGYIMSGAWIYFTLGTEGFDLPVQLMDNAICFDMNMGQFLLLQLLVCSVIIFFVVSLILFVSAFTKSTMGTMAILLVVIVGPAFIPFSQESKFLNHIIALAIVRMVDLKTCISSFFDYKFGGVILDLTTFALLFHVLLAVLLLLFMRRVFVKRSIRA